MEINDYQISEKLHQQALDYLAGRLSADQKSELFQKLSKSSLLEEEFLFALNLNRSLRAQELFEVRDWIREGISSSDAPSGKGTWKRMISKFKWWIFGSVLFVLLGAGIFSYYQQMKYEKFNQLAMERLQPLEMVLYTDTTNAPNLAVGIDHYRQGNYQMAKEYLLDYWQSSEDVNAALYLGVASLFESQYQEAIKWLITTVEQGNAPSDEIGRWYLTLAYLQAGEITQAKKLLEEWPPMGLYSKEAENLRSKLSD